VHCKFLVAGKAEAGWFSWFCWSAGATIWHLMGSAPLLPRWISIGQEQPGSSWWSAAGNPHEGHQAQKQQLYADQIGQKKQLFLLFVAGR
jgi:hypothetical protein